MTLVEERAVCVMLMLTYVACFAVLPTSLGPWHEVTARSFRQNVSCHLAMKAQFITMGVDALTHWRLDGGILSSDAAKV